MFEKFVHVPHHFLHIVNTLLLMTAFQSICDEVDFIYWRISGSGNVESLEDWNPLEKLKELVPFLCTALIYVIHH